MPVALKNPCIFLATGNKKTSEPKSLIPVVWKGDKLELFKIGFSWGGYESLIIPLNNIKPSKKMSINSEYWFRIHVGLESADDLINDLNRALNYYEKWAKLYNL